MDQWMTPPGGGEPIKVLAHKVAVMLARGWQTIAVSVDEPEPDRGVPVIGTSAPRSRPRRRRK